jgi:hypothetical protein
MARFDNTLNGYVKAKKYLKSVNRFNDVIDDHALVVLANHISDHSNRRYVSDGSLCSTNGELRRTCSTITCDHSVTSDPSRCGAHGRVKCVNRVMVK